MNSAAKNLEKQRSKWKWLMCGLCALIIYVLSIGPVIRFTQTKSNSGWRGLPKWVHVAYYPLFELPGGFFTDALDDYTKFWLGTH
jgi:hypothetical protein